MSKQEINQELVRKLLRKVLTEREDELVEVVQKKMEEALEEEKKPFEVEVPEDIETYYTIDVGKVRKIGQYIDYIHEYIYKVGEAFKTEEEAKLYDKERLLLFKIKKWAEIQNDGWKPKGDNLKYYIYYDADDNKLWVDYNGCYNYFPKLPYFKSEEIAQACIDEFGDEILEVLVNK